MKHCLFNLLAGLSLLLCVATVVIWIASYLRVLQFAGTTSINTTVVNLKVTAFRGSNDLVWESGRPLSIGEKPELNLRMRYWYLSHIGLRLVYNPTVELPDQYRGRYLSIRFPSWMLALLAGVMPGFWIVRRRRTPIAEGLCRSCGYDLRATPERCPECGTIPTKPAKEPA